MGEISLQDAIKQFLSRSKLKQGLVSAQLDGKWEEIMGKTVAKYTRKLQILNRTLYIETDIAPLKNELIYQKEKIIQRVNEAFEESVIDNVIIK